MLLIFFQLEKVEINNKVLYVEIADSPSERERGLMFRTYLPDSIGMLFIFDSSGIYPFWMKNTYIPLSIAFIDENFKIIDILDLEPLDERPVFPIKKFKYAIEVNKNWFKKKNIKVGDKVNFKFLRTSR